MYKYIKRINQARKASKSNENPFVEMIIREDVYVFRRGDLITAVTNQKERAVLAVVRDHHFKKDTTLCNIF